MCEVGPVSQAEPSACGGVWLIELNCRIPSWCLESWRTDGCGETPHAFGIREFQVGNEFSLLIANTSAAAMNTHGAKSGLGTKLFGS